MIDDGDDRPAARDLVDVLLDSTTEPALATVSGVVDDLVHLDAPADRTGRPVRPVPEDGGVLVWRGSREMRQAPMTVVEVVRGPAPGWRVRLTAPGVRCQRRFFVRADVSMPVLLRDADDQEYEVTGVDVSEGGLRCLTRDRLPLLSGAPLTAEFTVDDGTVVLSARLVRVRHGDGSAPTDLGLSFTSTGIREADRLRRYVFDQLRRHRATGLV